MELYSGERMKVLILGGSGYVGRHLADRLSSLGIEYTCASRHVTAPQRENFVVADTKSRSDLVRVMADIDVVVNCVAGDFSSISDGATCLVDAALESGKPLIVHMSSMAVYGRFEGIANENTPLDPSLGWYAHAKCNAEAQIERYREQGGRAVIFRPGCVYGQGSELWVGRIAHWLKDGRIGDLGVAGDGWSNLVHIDDVVSAVVSGFSMNIPAGQLEVFNLAAPDSPRWNSYFIDLALSIRATPVNRIRRSQLLLDSYIYSPPAKLIELLLRKFKLDYFRDLNPMPPALMRFFKQDIKLEATRAEKLLVKNWVSYYQGLRQLSV